MTNMFHDPSVKIPMIIYDPRAGANETRGSVCDALVESIDLAAIFVEAAGGKVPDHIWWPSWTGTAARF